MMLLTNNLFLAHWGARNPTYKHYFQTTWLNAHPPSTWALYLRPSDIPSGDQHLEAWHNRIKIHWQKMSEAIDFTVKNLYEELLYHLNMVNSPLLLNECLKDVETSKSRYRRTLKDYLSLSQIIPSIHAETQPLLALPSTDTSTSQQVTTITTATTTTAATTISTTTQPPTTTPDTTTLSSSILGTGNCECGAKKNNGCSLKKCMKCCGLVSSPCKLASHQKKKSENPASKNPFQDIINSAIIEKKTIFIKYMGGKTPGEVRPVLPVGWLTFGVSFEAICQTSGIKKKNIS